jgi:hypothetical protein
MIRRRRQCGRRRTYREALQVEKESGNLLDSKDARIRTPESKRDREMGSRVAMDHYEQNSKEAAQIHTKLNCPTACHNRITRLN